MITRSLLKTFEHVWSGDSALDQKAKGFADAYKKHLEGGPAADLPLREGQPACVFTLRPIGAETWLRALRLKGADQDYEMVTCGLQSVAGYTCDGAAVSLEARDGRITPESLRLIYDAHMFEELAARIMEASMLHPFRG